jgi:hypothetical protein
VSGRDDILRDLAVARDDAARLAAEQQAWRERVAALFDRAVAAGLSVDEIVETLGLSAKWAEHQLRRSNLRARRLFFGNPG